MGKTTLQTGIAIANSAIGSAMIIFPLNYLQYGIIENLIFLVSQCLIILGVDGDHSVHDLQCFWNASETF
jgi:hypothetical protein